LRAETIWTHEGTWVRNRSSKQSWALKHLIYHKKQIARMAGREWIAGKLDLVSESGSEGKKRNFKKRGPERSAERYYMRDQGGHANAISLKGGCKVKQTSAGEKKIVNRF